MTSVLPLKQRLGPVVITGYGARARKLECEYDGASDVIDLERDTGAGATTVITFLARHGRCGSDRRDRLDS